MEHPQQSPQPARWVERRAKLFEAGEYPDKGVSVMPEHLLRIAESFDRPVPLLIEHASSPLQLGYLTQVEAQGNELFGTLSLSEEANRLVERSGARSLSLGLSPDLTRIREVSLVQNPRVPTAQIFGQGPVFESSLPDLDAAYWRERFEALERSTRESGAEQIVQGFLRQGKLVPAQVPFARAILASDDTLEFDGSLETTSSWNDKQTIQDQLLYTVGHLNHDKSVGRLDNLDDDVLAEVNRTLQETSRHTGLTLTLALNYGSRAEITDAVRGIVGKVLRGELRPEDIDERTVGDHLYTAGMPDPDLLIRTAGEMRLSNYLLWQISYAELFVSDVLWPEFVPERLHEAIRSFASRHRRFGALDRTNQLPG